MKSEIELKDRVHVGVDLHKKVTQFAVLNPDGVVQQRRMENDVDQIATFLRGLPQPSRLAVEATGTWWWFVDLVEEIGHDVVLSNPKQTKAIAAARLKNDRVDAERLALLDRGDLLPTVWIAPRDVREARELLRHRIALKWLSTRAQNRLLAMLARRNLKPQTTKNWLTQAGHHEMNSLSLPESAATVRQHSWDLIELLEDRIDQLDEELKRRWSADERVRRLMTIPGIGWFTATALVVEIGDIHRFASAKRFACYLGLTPRVRSSADRIRTGHISKEGNRLLRWLLVSSTLQALRKKGPLRSIYVRIQQRKGKKIARVALARHLAGIVYHVWKQEIDYIEFLRHRGLSGASPDSNMIEVSRSGQ
jgi:transposase